MSNFTALRALYLYCRENKIPVDPKVAAIAIRGVGDYTNIRNTYSAHLQDAINHYLKDTVGLAVAKGQCKSAMATAFVDAFETGWMEGAGGDSYEPDQADSGWLASREDAELYYIEQLFVSLAEIKNSPDQMDDGEISDYAYERTQMYLRTLDTIYGQGKLRGKKNIILTLEGQDGKETCSTCQKYKGQRHRAKWWVSHELVPGPGNELYECGGWRCQHQLVDKDGNVWAGNLT